MKILTILFMLCGELYAADSTNGTVPVSGDGSVPLAHVALVETNGSADVTYDALVFKPDGSAYGRESDLTVAQGVDPAPGELHRACKYAGIRIEPKDPAGVYTVEVVVRDKVKKVELRLTRKFTVEE